MEYSDMSIKFSNVKIILTVLLLLPAATTTTMEISQFNVKLTGTHYIPELHTHITLTDKQAMLIGNDIPEILKMDTDICAIIRLNEASHSTNIGMYKFEISEYFHNLLHQADFKQLVPYIKIEVEKALKNGIYKKINFSLTRIFISKTIPQTLILSLDFDFNKTRYTNTIAIKMGSKFAIVFVFCTPTKIHARFNNQFELLVKTCTFDREYAFIA